MALVLSNLDGPSPPERSESEPVILYDAWIIEDDDVQDGPNPVSPVGDPSSSQTWTPLLHIVGKPILISGERPHIVKSSSLLDTLKAHFKKFANHFTAKSQRIIFVPQPPGGSHCCDSSSKPTGPCDPCSTPAVPVAPPVDFTVTISVDCCGHTFQPTDPCRPCYPPAAPSAPVVPCCGFTEQANDPCQPCYPPSLPAAPTFQCCGSMTQSSDPCRPCSPPTAPSVPVVECCGSTSLQPTDPCRPCDSPPITETPAFQCC